MTYGRNIQKTRARDLYDSSTLMAAFWPNSVFSSPSLPFVRSVFFRFPIPKWLWVRSVSSAIAHNSRTSSETVCQPFVKLSAIHYGLTFCLYMRSLYEASLGRPTLSFQTYTIRLLDLMPKSWNELLRHWRCGIGLSFTVFPSQRITLKQYSSR